MKNPIGVIQGRLLPKYHGRYQAHPVNYWKDEFNVAQECDLDLIEFILDFNDAEDNPLLRQGGSAEIIEITKKTGVSVQTICADYFMEAPLHSVDKNIAKNSLQILKRLLKTAVELKITDIVIPCVDQSSLENNKAVDRFVKQIESIIPIVEKENINLSLETDLAPKPFLDLLNQIDSRRVTVNYDIGNSASLGYDPIEELSLYGEKITDIHIKDRVLGGGPVILGQGDANFSAFFNKLKEFNYHGPFIMQAYRDEEGVKIFQQQLNWVSIYLENL